MTIGFLLLVVGAKVSRGGRRTHSIDLKFWPLTRGAGVFSDLFLVSKTKIYNRKHRMYLKSINGVRIVGWLKIY